MFNKELKKYPFGDAASKLDFPNRIPTSIVDGKVLAEINHDHYPQMDLIEKGEMEFKDFLLDRIHDYNCALELAEKQILDMQNPAPFIPQDYGFEYVGETRGDSFYTKGDVRLSRSGDMWFVTRGKEFFSLLLRDEQTAETVLHAMGVIRPEDVQDTVVHTLIENKLSDMEKDVILSTLDKEIYSVEVLLKDPVLNETSRGLLNEKIGLLKQQIEETLKS